MSRFDALSQLVGCLLPCIIIPAMCQRITLLRDEDEAPYFERSSAKSRSKLAVDGCWAILLVGSFT